MTGRVNGGLGDHWGDPTAFHFPPPPPENSSLPPHTLGGTHTPPPPSKIWGGGCLLKGYPPPARPLNLGGGICLSRSAVGGTPRMVPHASPINPPFPPSPPHCTIRALYSSMDVSIYFLGGRDPQFEGPQMEGGGGGYRGGGGHRGGRRLHQRSKASRQPPPPTPGTPNPIQRPRGVPPTLVGRGRT